MIATERPRIILPYPHVGQQTVRREAKRFNWLAAGRRWRKSTLCMAIAIEAAAQGQRILWGAPVFDQVRVAWGEMRHAAGAVANFNLSRMAITFPGGGTITFRSLDDPDNARGHTADGVVIDEVGDTKPEAWYEVLRPMLIDTNGWAWGIGTPRGHNWYFDEWTRAQGRDDSAAWQAPTLGVTITDDDQLIRTPHPLENPAIPFSEILDLFQTLPRHVFEQEILASFVSPGAAIFQRAWWAGGQNRFDANDAGIARQCIGRWISFDTALKDKDSSAFTACTVGELTPDYRLVIREVWRSRLQFPDLPPAIEHIARRYNVDGKLRGILVEDRASGISALQTLRASAEPWVTERLIAFSPRGDKPTRANQAGVWCKLGGVLLPHPSEAVPWLLDFESEIFSFPQSKFADQVDSFTQLILYVERLLAEGLHARGKVA